VQGFLQVLLGDGRAEFDGVAFDHWFQLYYPAENMQGGILLGMRIDPVLCKNILIAVEKNPNAGSGQFLNLSVDGYDANAIAQHIKYLWETKMISGVDVTHMQSPCVPEIAVTDITATGRAYLDQTEPDALRNKIGF
jgi:hypothetical protein